MDKVAVSTNVKGKPQGANRESLPQTESSQQETDVAQTFQTSNTFFRSDGRGFDLSSIPGKARLESGVRIRACTKGSEPCSCAACSQASTTDVVEDHEPEQQQPLTEESLREPDAIAEVSPLEIDNATAAPQETTSQDEPTPRIVEDSVSDLAEGQMKKADFLLQLHQEISRSIEPVLASVGQTSDGCPFLESWIDSYRKKDAAHIEQTVKKYAPDAARAATASEYIAAVGPRAVQMVQLWARMGMLSATLSQVPAAANVAHNPDALLDALGNINSRGENHAKGVAQKTIVQPKAKEGGARHVDDPAAIQKELGDGQPLAAEVRSRMEPAFGMSFAHVRSHTGNNASTLSTRLNARAFTVGNHVAFGNGEYIPGTPMGDALIAHELAHVAQQRNANASVSALESGDAGYNALETDADQVATSVVTSLWRDKVGWKGMVQQALPSLRSGLRIQRCSPSQSARPQTAADAERAANAGPCNSPPKAPTYVQSEDSMVPNLGPREFGTTSKLAAQFTYGACQEGGNWHFYLNTLMVRIKSAVQPENFRTNISNASDPLVSASTYNTIVRDLSPTRTATFRTTCGGRNWDDQVHTYSSRRTYWNYQFVQDHEAFHRRDWDGKYRPNLVVAEQSVRAHVIPSSQASSASAAIASQREQLDQFMIAAYQQTCEEYSPAQESRAYDDGAPQYQGLVDGINQRAASEGWTTP